MNWDMEYVENSMQRTEIDGDLLDELFRVAAAVVVALIT
jgi:hypothetical protein